MKQSKTVQLTHKTRSVKSYGDNSISNFCTDCDGYHISIGDFFSPVTSSGSVYRCSGYQASTNMIFFRFLSPSGSFCSRSISASVVRKIRGHYEV